jgi:hypothetical protein
VADSKKNKLGKEKVGDKLGKNKPKRLPREGTQVSGMKGSMQRVRTNFRSR